jgi:N-methylhydantoinase A
MRSHARRSEFPRRGAEAEGLRHIITFDMGGTTAKLGAVDDGKPVITPTFEVDSRHFRRFSGLPLNVAAVELLEIGSGGGSIATTEMGLIRVGPTSAGAEPGPICYGRSGTRPTVTDANLVLGYIDPLYFNGGAMTLDAEAARRGIEAEIARPLGIDGVAAAWGIHAVVNSNMETAMRVISIERGRDPRQYGLVAFGGAGPMHAARLARALGIRNVIVPHGAGVGSAIGLLNAAPRIDVSVTRILPLTSSMHPRIADIYDELEARARSEMAQLQPGGAVRWSRHAYFRHAGQGFEIAVELPMKPIGERYVADCLAAFFAAYEKSYGYRDTDSVVEAVDWQLVCELPEEDCRLRVAGSRTPAGAGSGDKPRGTRQAFFPEAGGLVECTIIDRDGLAPGQRVEGPAVIEEREATTVILPGDVAQLSANGHLVIETGAGERA